MTEQATTAGTQSGKRYGLEWFIAWRYIFSRERKLLFSVITLISFAGVALGVAAMIIVQGVMDGADVLIFDKIANLSPHLRIAPKNGQPFAPDAKLLAALRADPRILFAEPLFSRLTIVQIPGTAASSAVQLVGQEVLSKDSLFQIPNVATGGAIHLEDGELLLGRPVFFELHLIPRGSGQSAHLVSSQLTPTAMGPQPKILPVGVLGFYSTGFESLDALYAFVNEATIRELYMQPEGYDYIHIRLHDPFQAEAVDAWLKNSLHLSDDFVVTTWAQENSKFFSALKLEKFGMFITMLLVVLVAAFNIIGTLILMAIEKTPEIGILRAMGGSPAMVTRIFMLVGIIIGLTGTVIGVVLGLAGSFAIPHIKIPVQGVVFVDHIPIATRPLTVIIIIIASLLICAVAAIYPARQAARMNPIEALKFE